MNTYGKNFYDLLARTFAGDTSSARLQAWIDEVFANKYNQLQLDGFAFAPEMQLSFNYEQWQSKTNVAPMATYTDVDSPAVPIGEPGIMVVSGSIPRMKEIELLDEDKVRKQLIEEGVLAAQGVQPDYMAKLFNVADKLVQRHTNSLTYQRHQMVSTGALTLTDTNNPRGLKITLPAGIPDKNKRYIIGEARWWTDSTYATEGTNADPVGDLQSWIRQIEYEGNYGHIEVNKRYLDRILNHSAVVTALAQSSVLLAATTGSTGTTSLQYLTREWKKAQLESLLGCPVKVIDSVVSVKNYSRDTRGWVDTTLEAFSSDVLVFVPDGEIGEVLTVRPIYFQDPSATYGTFYDGRLLLTVAVDAVKKCQSFATEMTSLCVPSKAPSMFYLYPNDSDKTDE